MIHPALLTYCQQLETRFDTIPAERKHLLLQLRAYLQGKLSNKQAIQLVFICTHNSRRSHLGQVWAKVAAAYYKVPQVQSFSGGTEATAFNANAINALKRAGFSIQAKTEETNPVYEVKYDEQEAAIECFSKVYDDAVNPQTEFAAIMTCSEAEENCPFIPGAELRIGTTYDDPKAFDNTPEQNAKYDERCQQIATELFYVFSNLQAAPL